MTELSLSRDTAAKPISTAADVASDSPIGLVALWRLLRSNKLLIFVPMVIFAVLAALMTLRSADTFSAEAQLILTRDNIDIIEFQSSDRETVDFAVVSYAVNILNSRALAQQVVERLDLVNNPTVNPYMGLTVIEQQPDLIGRILIATGLRAPAENAQIPVADTQREYVLGWLQSTYVATALPNSNVVIVRVRTHDPDLSAAIANGAIDAYLDFSLEASQQEADDAIAALRARVQSLRTQLQRDQKLLQDAQSTIQIPSQDALQSLTFEISELRAREDDVTLQINALREAQTALADLDGASASTILTALTSDPRLAPQADAFLTTQPTLSTASAAQASLARNLSASLETRERQVAALLRSRDRLENRLREGSANLSELSRLEVELETTRTVYAGALARLKELVLESGLRNKGGRFLARAVPPVGADSQFRRRIVVVAMVLGALVGATIVLVREAANERVRSLSDIPGGVGRFGWVEVPRLKRGLRLASTRRNQRFLKGKDTGFSEAVRNCRRLVMEQYDAASPRIVCVLSSLPNEGKTTLCGALARSFILVDKSVLVIDGDMRVRGLTKAVLGNPPKLGLQQAIQAGPESGKSYVTKAKDLGFDILPAGEDDRNPADLLETENFKILISKLHEDYDVVIIDTPPTLLFPEARSIAAMSTYTVMVAGFNKTPKSALREAMSILPTSALARTTIALCNTPGTTGARFGIPEKRLGY